MVHHNLDLSSLVFFHLMPLSLKPLQIVTGYNNTLVYSIQNYVPSDVSTVYYCKSYNLSTVYLLLL